VRGIYFDINEAPPLFAGMRKPGDKPGVAINAPVFTAGITVDSVVGKA
jgi:hypothetical protein